MTDKERIDWNRPTLGELGSELCRLQTKAQAADFWRRYVAYLSRPDAELLGKTAEEVAAANIGYLMGYYGPEERQRVYGLFDDFGVEHPVFGRMRSEVAR